MQLGADPDVQVGQVACLSACRAATSKAIEWDVDGVWAGFFAFAALPVIRCSAKSTAARARLPQQAAIGRTQAQCRSGKATGL